MSEQWKDSDNDDVQMPLATGEGEELEFGGEKKTRVNTATMAVIALFAAGLGMIYLLGLQNKPRAASAESTAVQQQVESVIAEMINQPAKADKVKALFADTERLVQLFYNYPGKEPQGLEELAGNPFEHEGPRDPFADPVPVAVVTNSAEQERYRRAAESFSALKLQSIMVTQNRAAALINNKVVTAGAKLGDFTVAEIDSERVVLSFGTRQFELRLQRSTPAAQ